MDRNDFRPEGVVSAALAGHLLFGLLLWPIMLSFREGFALLPVLGLLFVAGQSLRGRSPLAWHLAVGSEGALCLVFLGVAGALAQHRRWVIEMAPGAASADFPLLALFGLLLSLGLLSAATLMFLLRRETRLRYRVR